MITPFSFKSFSELQIPAGVLRRIDIQNGATISLRVREKVIDPPLGVKDTEVTKIHPDLGQRAMIQTEKCLTKALKQMQRIWEEDMWMNGERMKQDRRMNAIA